MKNHQHINANSGDFEYYTPSAIIEAARRTLGGIDLDPASSAVANKRVGAKTIFEMPSFEVVGKIGTFPIRRFSNWGGVSAIWSGRTWMNHPFGPADKSCAPDCKQTVCIKRGWHTAKDLPGNPHWVNAIVREFKADHITGCCITFASTSEQWFQPLLLFPQCFLSPRTNYLTPDGKIKAGVTKGSVVTYFGNELARFAAEFRTFGKIKIPY